jgi:hypothetical protein
MTSPRFTTASTSDLALFLERAIRDVRPTEPLPGVAEDAVAHPLPELLGNPLGDGPAHVMEPEIDDTGKRCGAPL